jgi:hypothetical protein
MKAQLSLMPQLVAPTVIELPPASGEFSKCIRHADCADPYCRGRLYRYLLRIPTGIYDDRVCLFCLANPSTATPLDFDPTVTRTVGYARRWGFGWDWVTNARGWRETDPRMVPADPLAIGPENDEWIARAVEAAELVVCGWGGLGGERGPVVLDIIRRAGKVPHALKMNKDGTPAHPLYLWSGLEPKPIGEPPC